MNPEYNPNPLYVYEVLDDSSDIENSDDNISADEYEAYWEALFAELAEGPQDFEDLWTVYERTSKKRKREHDETAVRPSELKKGRYI